MFASCKRSALLLVLVSSLFSTCTANVEVPVNLTNCLGSAVQKLVLPTDSGYNDFRRIFSLRFSKYPLAIARAQSVQEIQNLLSCGRLYKRRVVARNGGHSFEGNSVQSGTIVVDLRLMNDVKISADKATAVIQGGANLGEVYYNAWFKARKGFNGGTCPSVGISGVLLGGGYGHFSRKYGMSCDNIVELSMVTWEGEVITATASNAYRDLFWASCGGGGGNFGVVTSWKVRLFTPPAKIQYAKITVGSSRVKNVELWDYFQRWGPKVDADVGLEIAYTTRKESKIEMHSLSTVNLKSFVAASRLPSYGITKQDYKSITYIDVIMEQATPLVVTSPKQLIDAEFWKKAHVNKKEKSFYLDSPLSKATLNKLIAAFEGGDVDASMQFHVYGGAIANKSNNATAFVHRHSLGLLQVSARWDLGNAAAKNKALKWLEQVETILSADGPKGAYINYIDFSLGGASWQNAYYGSNYAKLQGIKTKYDPNNFFTFPKLAIEPKNSAGCVYQPCV